MISVTVDVPEATVANGVLIALGCALGGWSLHMVDGQPRYVHNLYGRTRHAIQSNEVMSSGRHTVELTFEPDGSGGGPAALQLDGKVVAEGRIDRFTPAVFNEVGIGVTCGYEWGPAVGDDYSAPFAFNGKIVRAEIITRGPAVLNPALEIAAILAKQ